MPSTFSHQLDPPTRKGNHPAKHATCWLRRWRSCPGARRSISHLPSLVYCSGACVPASRSSPPVSSLSSLPPAATSTAAVSPLYSATLLQPRPRPCLHRTRAAAKLIIACSKGGTSIEALAEKYPDLYSKRYCCTLES